jgi:hypothetical protein
MIHPNIDKPEPEGNKRRYKYLWTDDKIQFYIGIFFVLCITCSVVLFTVAFQNNVNNVNNVNIVNIVNIVNDTVVGNNARPYKYYNVTNVNYTQISGIYKVNGTSIYFESSGIIRFKETMMANVLIVGGGGGASYGGGWFSGGSGTGGGGAGCVGEGTLIFNANTVYDIVVGNGGRAVHNKVSGMGGYSAITGTNINERADGGGFGGYYTSNSAGGGSYGFRGEVVISEEFYQFNNTYFGKSAGGKGTLTYHSHSGGRGDVQNRVYPGSGGGGAGGAGKAPIDNNGGIGGDYYLWKINNRCYGRGGNGGSLNGKNVSIPMPNNGDGGGGASTSGGTFSTSGSSGIVIINVINIIR